MAAKRPAKKAATKKATKRAPSTTGVSFEESIPTIKREGGTRRSKYDDLLNKIKEKAQSGTSKSVAVMSFETQSEVTGRYTSVKQAAKRRDDADHWTIVTRNVDGEFRLYLEWNDEAQTSDDE